ncbi:hypothetical protein ACWD6Q_34320, partial [Streptomyces nigra]
MLVVVEHGAVQRGSESLLQLEAEGRGDVLEADGAERRSEPHEDVDHIVDVRRVEDQWECVQT